MSGCLQPESDAEFIILTLVDMEREGVPLDDNTPTNIATRLGWDRDRVVTALVALNEGGFIQATWS